MKETYLSSSHFTAFELSLRSLAKAPGRSTPGKAFSIMALVRASAFRETIGVAVRGFSIRVSGTMVA